MSEVIIFPWLRIAKPVFLSDYSLLPYEQGDYLEGHSQNILHALDDYLEHFHERSNTNIYGFTLLLINSQIANEINEELETKLLSLIELIAFCGLSSREFFSVPETYCNRDNFQARRLSINYNSAAYKIITRRRDGWSESIVTANTFQEIKPDHVFISRIKINEELLSSLIKAQSYLENWDKLFQGIVNFNLSNTDSWSVSEAMELVFLVAAFEQLLNCKLGKEDDLAHKFINLFNVASNIDSSNCTRLKKHHERWRKFNLIQEIWIRDLFRVRGDLAHGKNHKHKSYKSSWNLKEHLFLASFIFPLVLKEYLSRHGIYTKNEQDDLLTRFFPRLLDQETIFPWYEVWRDFLWDQVRE